MSFGFELLDLRPRRGRYSMTLVMNFPLQELFERKPFQIFQNFLSFFPIAPCLSEALGCLLPERTTDSPPKLTF